MPKPVTTIYPGVDLTVTTFGGDQPEYTSLPGWRGYDGKVVTRWKFSFMERLRILVFGDLWLTALTSGHRLQPVKLNTKCPMDDFQKAEVTGSDTLKSHPL
jgi:hypothetical protein